MNTCETCRYYMASPLQEPCDSCHWDGVIGQDPTNWKAPTNADRIRTMSDEELADFLGGIFTIETDIWGNYDPRLVVTQDPRVEIRDKEGMVDWLKSPVEVDNGT